MNKRMYLRVRGTAGLDDIGRHFEIGCAGVCQVSRRIAGRLKKDKSLVKAVNKNEDNLSIIKVPLSQTLVCLQWVD